MTFVWWMDSSIFCNEIRHFGSIDLDGALLIKRRAGNRINSHQEEFVLTICPLESTWPSTRKWKTYQKVPLRNHMRSSSNISFVRIGLKTDTTPSSLKYLIDQLVVEVWDFKVSQTALCLRLVSWYQVLLEQEVHLERGHTQRKHSFGFSAWTQNS